VAGHGTPFVVSDAEVGDAIDVAVAKFRITQATGQLGDEKGGLDVGDPIGGTTSSMATVAHQLPPPKQRPNPSPKGLVWDGTLGHWSFPGIVPIGTFIVGWP
jgi:hypothetical protein